MSVELHLPDLPEVPISLGPVRGAPARPRAPWHLRLRDALSAYLPLLLMALLALASWWLVKNSPGPVTPVQDSPVSSEPDYTMSGFALERFDAAGQLRLRIEGDELRHFPASDRIEIDGARIRAVGDDGRVTQAQAHQAVGKGDASELQLVGGAEVTGVAADGTPVLMRSEFLHAYFKTERVRSHLPVQVRVGTSEWRAAGLDYDHATQRLELSGPMRAELSPRALRKGP